MDGYPRHESLNKSRGSRSRSYTAMSSYSIDWRMVGQVLIWPEMRWVIGQLLNRTKNCRSYSNRNTHLATWIMMSMNLSYFHITPRVYTHMPFIRILSIIPTMDTTESEICPGFHKVLENMKQQLLCVMQLYSILYSKLCGLWPI